MSRKSLTISLLLGFLSITFLFAQEGEVEISPSMDVRFPDGSEPIQPKPESAPIGSFQPSNWYFYIGYVENQELAMRTGEDILAQLKKILFQNLQVIYSKGHLYIGPVSSGKILEGVQFLRGMGLENLELYRPD